MLKRLQIKNYKSLVDIDIEFGYMNVLIGRNMSGKSNLIDGLKFLADMTTTGLDRAFYSRGGVTEVIWKGKNNGSIQFKIVFDIREETSENTYEYEISIAVNSQQGTFFVERERLLVKTNDKEYKLIEREGSFCNITYANGKKAFGPPPIGVSALQYSSPDWEGTKVKEYISKWYYYNLIPLQMKTINPTGWQKFLVENGNNFSSWFQTIQTRYPKIFQSISNAAKDALHGLEDIMVPPTQAGTTFMLTKEKYIDDPISLSNMSNGEIVFLALLSLIYTSYKGSELLCIEELENHLHPKLYEIFIELFTQLKLAREVPQLIITTHSPYLLNKINIDDIIVLKRYDGATQCLKPATKKYLKEILDKEELSIGDLWYSGELESD